MTDTTTPTPEPEAPAAPPAQETVSVAEFKKLQAESRKWEERAKQNTAAAKEAEKLRAASMTETEAAVAAARAEAATEARRSFGGRLVAAELRAATAGRSVDVDALLEGLDASRFLDDEGEPDVAALTAWVDRVAPKVEAPPADETDPGKIPFPPIGQGARGETPPLNSDALTADLKNLLGIR